MCAGVFGNHGQPQVQRAQRQAGVWREQQCHQGRTQRYCAGSVWHRISEGTPICQKSSTAANTAEDATVSPPQIINGIAAFWFSYRAARAWHVQVGAEFLAQHYPVHTVLLPNPTWANHNKIFPLAGIKDVRKYRYFKPATKGLDYEVGSTPPSPLFQKGSASTSHPDSQLLICGLEASQAALQSGGSMLLGPGRRYPWSRCLRGH